MHAVAAFLLDAALFIGLAWLIWRLCGRTLPVCDRADRHWPGHCRGRGLPSSWGVPSPSAQTLGWVGVLLLAFTAGMETRHSMASAPSQHGPSGRRVLVSAVVAMLLPFAAGALLSYYVLDGRVAWAPPAGNPMLGALAVGLCVAVSALPVLIGIVRELDAAHRPFGRIAVRIAVIDDAVLWIGLAVLLLVAQQDADGLVFSRWQALALCVPVVMLAASRVFARWTPPLPVLALLLVAYLAAGAWASAQLGLHELLGAYFAGTALPAAWLRRVPIEYIGRVALMVLAPLFFGHSGLKVAADALNWGTLQIAGLVLVVSVAAKLAAGVAVSAAARWQPPRYAGHRHAVAMQGLDGDCCRHHPARRRADL